MVALPGVALIEDVMGGGEADKRVGTRNSRAPSGVDLSKIGVSTSTKSATLRVMSTAVRDQKYGEAPTLIV